MCLFLPVRAVAADSDMQPESARSTVGAPPSTPSTRAAVPPAEKGAAPSYAESAKLREALSHRYEWVREMVKSNEEPGALLCARTAAILQVGGHGAVR